MAICFVICILLALCLGCARSQFEIDDPSGVSCASTGLYFNFGVLQCSSCPNTTSMIPTGFTCSCRAGFKANINDPRVLTCTACRFGITTTDGYFCTSCDNSTASNSATGVCTCTGSQALVEVYDDTTPATCRDCGPPSLASSGTQSCVPCPDCNCQPVAGLCFTAEQISQFSSSDPCIVIGDITPAVTAAAAACNAQADLRNQTACQALANMCVSQTYASSSSGTCSFYSTILQSGTAVPSIEDAVEWRSVNLPWLYYSTQTNDAIQNDDAITTGFQFGTSTNNQLDLVVAQYRANGTYIGLLSVQNGLIQLCKDTPEVMNAAYEYGTTFQSQCSLSVSSLVSDGSANTYFDMFLRYTENGVVKLYPVPVLVLDMDANQDTTNSVNWQFVRRFYLVNNYFDLSNDGNIWYASTMTLSISIRPNLNTGQIFPPILRIQYSTVPASQQNPVTTSFAVSYSSSTVDQNEGLKITLSLLGSFAFLFAIIETSGWRRREGLQYVELTTILQFLLYLLGNLANVFFGVMLAYTTILLLLFKRQNTVSMYVPGGYQVELLTIFVSIAVGFKMVQVFALILWQSSVDMFLVDWERPSSDSSSKKVSIWRTLFIANEWNEIQTLRKINTVIQLFLVLFFLEVVGFKNLALENSSGDLSPPEDSYMPPYNPLLRFAIGGLVYLIIAIVQVLYFKLIHERFVHDQIIEFVDLCSISNVSIFILSQKNFGYYIHGRSVHGKADTDMVELNMMLKREEENLVSSRGLVAGTENQVFEIMIPVKMRAQYDKVYQPLQQMKSQPAARGGNTSGNNLMSESFKAYFTMRNFLTAFIDHSLQDLDYIVKDKMFLEKLLAIEFQEPIDNAFFINDEGHSFDEILFYGHEAALLILDMLVFTITDFIATDFVLAAIVTYIVGWVLKGFRQILGRYNLARKTLVDKRFLI